MMKQIKAELLLQNEDNERFKELVKMNILFINQIQKLTQLNQTSNNFIRNSVFSSVMMTNLINDLLDLAKLNNNAFKFNIERSNVIECIEKAFSIVNF